MPASTAARGGGPASGGQVLDLLDSCQLYGAKGELGRLLQARGKLFSARDHTAPGDDDDETQPLLGTDDRASLERFLAGELRSISFASVSFRFVTIFNLQGVFFNGNNFVFE